MTRDDRQRRIQDYLDDRLGSGERQAFEDEIRGDPELAHRVAFLREIGEALQAEPDPLPPGFYTRLGARFGEAVESRRWFRPLSWETAGLVAAVALAAVLFVPSLIRREMEDLPGFIAPTGDLQTDEVAAPAPPTVAVPETIADELAATPTPAAPKKAAEKLAADDGESFAPVPPSDSLSDLGYAEERIEESTGKGDADTVTPQPAERSDRPAATNEGKLEVLRERAQQVGAAQSREEAPTLVVSELEGIALEPGTVAPEIVRLEPSAVDLSKRMAQARAAPYRSILVGPRAAALDCLGARLRLSADGYEILLARGGSLHGCRFRLPDDGRPVRVVDPP